MNKLFITAILFLLVSCASHKNPQIQITTNFGPIEVELFADKAPKTVTAFLSYIDSGLYKNSSFYRVLLEEGMSSKDNSGLVQGGIWQSNNKKAVSMPGIPHESPKETGLSHTTGTLSLARTTLGSANTEFFICVGDKTELDSANADGQGFAAFGRVVKGMKTVREIQNEPANGEAFIKPIVILDIKRL